MKEFLSGFIRNTVFANVLLGMIIFAGLASSALMIRELLPTTSVDVIMVQVPYPGAGPEEVEEGISLKIEDALQGVQGIKQLTTVSAEGSGTAVVEVKTGEDVQEVKDRVTDRINAIQTFPDDAEKPTVTEILLEHQNIAVSVAGDIPEQQLRELAMDVKDELLRESQVSAVTVVGARDYEISIEISEKDLRRFGLTFDEVARVIRNSSLNIPGGDLKSDREEIKLRTMARDYTGNEFADIVLMAREDGTSIRLGDIATIKDGFTEDVVNTRFRGMPSITLMVKTADGEDALTVAAAVKDYVAEKNQSLEARGLENHVKLYTWFNSSKFITQRIDMLLKNGFVGLTLVFFMLWVFLDLRLAVWVTLGIPISLSGALFLMYVLDESINMISLFAMIMVLGIIVDDAIVVGEAIYYHRKRGEGPIKAAIEGTFEVGMPVIAAVLTTVVAFMPLLFVDGVMGKFIKVIPIVVICALLVSLVEGLIILPAHLGHLPDISKPPKHHNRLHRILDETRLIFNNGLEWFVSHVYRPFMASALGWRYVSLACIFAILFITIGTVKAGWVKYEMFPSIDTSFVFARVEFPEGTPIGYTRDAILRMEEGLREVEKEMKTISGNPMVDAMQSMIGVQLNMDDAAKGSQASPNKGEIMVELLDSEERGIYFRDILRRWQEKVGTIPGVLSLVYEGDAGGPPGAPIEVWLMGEDLEELKSASADLKEHLGTYAGVFQIEDDFRPGKRELRIELKPEARQLGLTNGDLGRQIRQGFYGEETMRVQRGRDEVKVWVRYPREERRTVADMESIRIRTPQGDEVPVGSVADVTLEEGYTTINRMDGLRRITVTADVFTEISNTTEIVADMEQEYLPSLLDKYHGVTASFAGAKRDSAESLGSLMIGFPLAVLGIYLIIATLFRSYVQPLVIMVTVPFGIIGAIWGHMALGYTVTMMSLFGIVALTGVVVNDAIVLIEAVNHRLSEGMRFEDAIVDGGARRFRAILLTTVTTVGGLTPLIMETSMQAQFLIPMALTLAAGVAFATVLTLIVIPLLLYILNDIRRAGYFLLKGVKPTAEFVEPATKRKLSDEEFYDDSARGGAPEAAPAG